MSTSPKRPTLPEGTDPVAALRQIQRQLAKAPWPDREKEGGLAAGIAYSDGLQEAGRTAGAELAPIVDAVEVLVGTLRQRLQEMDPFGPDASDPSWYGSAWACPVDRCSHVHREEVAVSSTDAEAARRVQVALLNHFAVHTSDELRGALVLRALDWPAHCSEWIAGADPENPEMCPEYASPGTDKCALHDPRQVEYAAELMARQGWLSPAQANELRRNVQRLTMQAFTSPLGAEQRKNVVHGGSPEAAPREDLEKLLGDLVDDDPCSFDHHGYCQAHDWFDTAECPNSRAKRLIAELVGSPRTPLELALTQIPSPMQGDTLTTDAAEAKPPARVAHPPVSTEWQHGFPPEGTATMWRCQRCGTSHEGNPRGCLHCGHTVLDPGHWMALPPAGTEA